MHAIKTHTCALSIFLPLCLPPLPLFLFFISLPLSFSLCHSIIFCLTLFTSPIFSPCFSLFETYTQIHCLFSLCFSQVCSCKMATLMLPTRMASFPVLPLFLLLLPAPSLGCPTGCRCYSLTVECGSIGLKDIPQGIPSSTQVRGTVSHTPSQPISCCPAVWAPFYFGSPLFCPQTVDTVTNGVRFESGLDRR